MKRHVSLVQSAWRGRQVRKEYNAVKEAVTFMAAVWRRYHCKRQYAGTVRGEFGVQSNALR
jgi:hypothetical protein